MAKGDYLFTWDYHGTKNRVYEHDDTYYKCVEDVVGGPDKETLEKRVAVDSLIINDRHHKFVEENLK